MIVDRVDADLRAWEDAQVAWEMKTPICDKCKEHILDEDFFKNDDDEILCEDHYDEWLQQKKDEQRFSVADYVMDN